MASYSKGIIDFSQWSYLNSQEQECQAKLREGNYNEDVCSSLLDKVIDSSSGSSSNAKISFYDTRILDNKRFPPRVEILEAYFGNVWPHNIWHSAMGFGTRHQLRPWDSGLRQ